jgi:serine/threonine protein kinase
LLKYENKSWVPKIADFGISKFVLTGMTHTHEGTPLYEAPELWDVWHGKVEVYDVC